MSIHADAQEPIAIIGAATRLSGQVSALGDLWDMISKEKTGHCKVPEDRWDGDLWEHPDKDRKGGLAVKHGYFLQQDLGKFDAPFFSTTAKEAAALDPMKRLLLEISYEALENAGVQIDSLMNTDTGCYVGCMNNDYEMLSLHDIYDNAPTAASATSEAMLSNRVSWFYGLKGPSLTLDTACSSSLYALHLACQSLKLRETNMSLVAGVNLMISPNTMHQLSAMHMLSPEGISHTFDDRANGYGRGEGIGCLIVKRLSDAIRDGDTIRAVIRNTGANADGKTSSITAPSSEAQAELINKTYAEAGLPLTSTQYFESHGTGTPVGDPIEMTAIANTIGAARKAQGLDPLWVGSIKPSVGHTEGCSGLAGVFKSIVLLEKGKLVPTYGVKTLNPKLKLKDWHLALPGQVMDFPGRGQRRISVNSFGFGGANAHAILDDAYHYLRNRGMIGNHSTTIAEESWDSSDSGYSTPGSITPPLDGPDMGNKKVFVFSAKDKTGIERMATRYASYFAGKGIQKQENNFLNNLAYTLASRRTPHDFRSFAVASNLMELGSQLSSGLPKIKRASRRDYNNIVMVFTGQGAQWAAMGSQMFSNSIFRNSVKESGEVLKSLGCAWDATEELQKPKETSNIAFPEYSQTLCTVLQVALVDVLRHWNITPKATVGHSSGEIGAAYAAGYLSHEVAVQVAYTRGLSSEQIKTKGAMMAAGLSTTEANEYLSKLPVKDSAVIACVNSPSSVTLSGDVDAIEALEETISADGKFARKLLVKTAYHSPHMRSVADSYHEKMGTIKTLPGNGYTSMFSSLTGKKVESPEELDAKYWVANMCASVQFASAVDSMMSHMEKAPGSARKTQVKYGAFIEVGPHSALQGPVQQSVTASSNKSGKEAPYFSMILRGKDAIETSLKVAGNIWSLGIDSDLTKVNNVGIIGRTVPKALTDLPPYAWSHTRSYWHESFIAKSMRYPKAPRNDLLGVPELLQNIHEPRWRNNLRIAENPWIEDHKITGTVLYPGAGMLVMAIEAAYQMADASKEVSGFQFSHVNFERGMVVTTGDDAAVETRLSLIPSNTVAGQFTFTVFSTSNGKEWSKHCFGQINLKYTEGKSEIENTEADPAWTEQMSVYKTLTAAKDTENVEVDGFYQHLEGIGMQYGPLFRNVVSLTAVPSGNASYGTVIVPDTKGSMPENYEYEHVMHPATMDAIFHLVLAAFNGGKPVAEASVPYHIDEMYVAAKQPKGANSRYSGYGHLVNQSADGHETVGDLIVSDEDWSAPKMVIKNFYLRTVSSGDEGHGVGSANAYKDKAARLEYYEDVDFIQTNKSLSAALPTAGGAQALGAWMDRIAHKKPIHHLLAVVGETSDNAESILHAIQTRVGEKLGIKNLSVVATSEAVQQFLASAGITTDIMLLENGSALADTQSYDVSLLIGSDVVEGTQGLLPKVKSTLSAQGQLVVVPTKGSSISRTMASLESSGFSDMLDSDMGFLTTPKQTKAVTAPTNATLLLPSGASPSLLRLASNLTKNLESQGVMTESTVFSAESVSKLADQYVISLLEIESPLIYSFKQEEFDSFKTLASTIKHLFWVTRGSLLEQWSAGVEYAPAVGLLRVMRNEYPLAIFSHLDLSAFFHIESASNSALITKVWNASLPEDAETEFAELRGSIHIPRAEDATGLEVELKHHSGNAEPVLVNLREQTKALKFSQEQDIWVEDEEATLPLDADEVEIEVDFATVSGLALGNEIVGRIAHCGSNVKSFSTGQRVIALGGALKDHVRQNISQVAALPEHLSGEGAAALSSSLVTAEYALKTLAGLHAGDKILIHDAESSLGLAAVQYAQSVGAELFVLVSSKAAKDLLIGTYGLSPEQVFDSSLTYFVSAIKQRTAGAGVDAVFACGPNSAIIPSLAVLADFGSFLDVGAGCNIVLPATKQNASLFRVNMEFVQKSRPQIVTELFQAAFASSNLISPEVRTVAVGKLGNVAALQAQAKTEKIVISINAESKVLIKSPPPPKLQLDKKGTYVLAGGLGALGLNIASMLIDSGAKHLVFLSRSGGAKNEKDLAGFRDRGCEAEAFACSVNDKEGMDKIFAGLKSQGRTIKGMIQAAMVLEDSIFDNMTYDKWSKAFTPKTQGSKNLMSQLSAEDKPWFIFLSSITGVIGNVAQANYVSGNTFEDALAAHATKHLGISATSINVGVVEDSAHFTDAGTFGSFEDYIGRYSHRWFGMRCTVNELKLSIAAIARGTTLNGVAIPPQVVLGLGNEFPRQMTTTATFLRDRKFNHRILEATAADEEADGGENMIEKLGNSASQAEAAAVVESILKGQIGAAIGVEPEDIDGNKPLPEFGVDSLKAVEIRNHTKKELQSDISVFELLSAVPLVDLAVKIASRSKLVTAKE